jgi:tetratricopeptide (TPR) repeat protein
LSVFHGSFSLDAAEQVCRAQLEPLAALVDASLVRRRESVGGDARFDLLAVIREYAAGKIYDSPEEVELRERHCALYAEWVERARREADDAQERWGALVRDELPNIRAALTWAADHGDPVRLARMVWMLGRSWHRFGLGSESRGWAERALAAIGNEPTEEHAGCLKVLGNAAFSRGDYSAASHAMEAGAALWRKLGDKTELAQQLGNLGSVALELGDFERAFAHFEEAAAVASETGDIHEELATLGNLGVAYSHRGDLDRAAATFEQVAATAAQINDDDNRAWALSNLGGVREELGQHEAAETALAEALGLLDRLGWKEGLAYTLAGLASIAIAREEPARAARLLSAAERLGESIDLGWQSEEAEKKEATLARLQESLGPEFEGIWEAAALVPLEELIADESLRPSIQAAARPATWNGSR